MQYFVGFISPVSTKADNVRGRKLNDHLMASCVKNIGIKNY